MVEVVEKPASKSARILNPQRMGLAEQLRQDWVVNAEEGTSIEQVLAPEYWAHMASQMQPFDHVEVRLETGEWVVDLIVVNTGRNWAQVHLQHTHQLQKRNDNAVSAKHRVEWKGPQLKWCVIRNADNELLQKDHTSKTTASEWLTNYERATER